MGSFEKIMKWGLGSAVIGFTMLASPKANALSFTYVQNFSNGVLTGSFSGNDDDLNGLLQIGNGSMEFDSFEMRYVGGGREILWVLEDLEVGGNGLDYDIAEKSLNILVQNEQSSGDFILCGNNSVFCGSVAARIDRDSPFTLIDFATEKATVTPVPSPAVVLPSLVGMGLSAIRKRRAVSSEEE